MRICRKSSWTLACACALVFAESTHAQRPALPEPRAKTPGTIRVPLNTRQRAKFDIRAEKLHNVALRKPRLRGSMVQAQDLTISVVLVNDGSDTFAFAGNQVDASIIEGHFDYRQRVSIDRRRVPYYPARGIFDIVIRAKDSIELPIVIRGQKTQRVGYWPVPSPTKPRPGLRSVRLESGNAKLMLRPEVWYTIDARLKPAKDDEVDDRHAVFINVRFGRDGNVVEMKGPYLY